MDYDQRWLRDEAYQSWRPLAYVAVAWRQRPIARAAVGAIFGCGVIFTLFTGKTVA